MEKKRYSKHSEELKAMIILEYKNTDMGYHLIAKKFGIALRCCSWYHTA